MLHKTRWPEYIGITGTGVFTAPTISLNSSSVDGFMNRMTEEDEPVLRHRDKGLEGIDIKNVV